MSKNESNGNVKVAWILDTSLTNPKNPSATELNAALDLSPAIAWQDYEVGASDSADTDDRSLVDLGNAVSRGAASYGATLSMFRNKDNTDSAAIYVQAFQAFRTMRTVGWLVVRVNKSNSSAFAAGDTVSAYKLIADTVADDTEGDDSVKFTVTFLPQAILYFHTIVAAAGVISGVGTTKAANTGTVYQLAPVLGGASIVSRATYTSSARAIATVSSGGTVKAISAGTADIIVAHGSATAAITQALTVSTPV